MDATVFNGESVKIALGGGLLWRILPALRRYTLAPGPILALSSINMQGRGNAIWPRVLQVENIGDKPALEIHWEIREYSHIFLPPRFERTVDKRAIALKPQENFILDVIDDASESRVPGHSGELSRAHFSHYDIMIWCIGPNRVKYLSHFRLSLGDLTSQRVGMNPVQRALAFLRVRMWIDELISACKIRFKVRLRRHAYDLRQWIVERSNSRKPLSLIE